MDAAAEVQEAITTVPAASSRWCLVGSLYLGLSILYQVYFYEFDEGVIVGGEKQRLLMKVFFVSLFLYAIRRYLSLAIFAVNLVLRLPLAFIALTIVAIAPFLNNEYLQAVNLLFFVPLLFVDWNRPGADRLYRLIWTVIVGIVAIQLFLDPVMKLWFKVGWKNAALIGGMGNANVFGVFLIAAGLACAFLLRGRFRYLAPVLFVVTVLTGSLAATILGFVCAFVRTVALFLRSPSRVFLIIGVTIAALPALALGVGFVADLSATEHAFKKFLALLDLFSGHSSGGSESIAIRVDYTQRGLNMLDEAPLAVITGHPQGRLMYSGDGMWIALLVTYGLPLTLYFLAVNLWVMYRGLRSRTPDLVMSAWIVATIMAFLVTNRILDYWPAPFVYLLAFSYLVTRGVYRGTGEQHVKAQVVPVWSKSDMQPN